MLYAAVLSKVANVNIRVGEVNATIHLIILKDNYLTHDLIIGTDYLNQQHIVLIKRNDELYLRTLAPLTVNIIDVEGGHEELQFDRLAAERKKVVFEVLQKYRECFPFSLCDLGKINGVGMHIRYFTDEPVCV